MGDKVPDCLYYTASNQQSTFKNNLRRNGRDCSTKQNKLKCFPLNVHNLNLYSADRKKKQKRWFNGPVQIPLIRLILFGQIVEHFNFSALKLIWQLSFSVRRPQKCHRPLKSVSPNLNLSKPNFYYTVYAKDRHLRGKISLFFFTLARSKSI